LHFERFEHIGHDSGFQIRFIPVCEIQLASDIFKIYGYHWIVIVNDKFSKEDLSGSGYPPFLSFNVNPFGQFNIKAGVHQLHIELTIIPTQVEVGEIKILMKVFLDFLAPRICNKMVFTFFESLDPTAYKDIVGFVELFFMGVPVCQ
jgi:hypothetical protein